MPAIGYKKYPMSDKSWDGPKNEANLKSGEDKSYYEKAYAWIDSSKDSTKKNAYKFIHAEVATDGTIGDTNIKACQSGIGVLNGAMGGSNIPDADRQAVYNHLAKHLKDAKVEPAELKSRSKEMPTYARYGLIPRGFKVFDLRAIQPAEGQESVIEGHAAVFNQPTDICGCFNEVIRTGAFNGCDFSDVLFSTNHDLGKLPLARSRNNTINSTLQLGIDDQGLFVHASLDTDNNMDAKALYSAVERGDINGMSFIFRVDAEEWQGLDSDIPTRYINKIAQVIEVSAVSWPAYPGTDINARDQYTLESAKNALESARSKLDSFKGEENTVDENDANENREALEFERYKAELLINL